MKKQQQHSRGRSFRFAMALTLAAAGLLAVPAMAQAGPFGRGGKGCRGGGGGGKGVGKLMFGDIKRLQKRLSLSAQQVAKIKKMRQANKGQRVKVRLEMARIHAKMRVEWLANKPSVWKLKKLHMRALKLKTKMSNRRFQIRLKVALILTPSQRVKLKRRGGFGHGFGRHGRRGKRRGWGRFGGRGGGKGYGRRGGRGGGRGGGGYGMRGGR